MFNSYVLLCVGCGFSSVRSARVEERALPLTSIATSLLLSVIASEHSVRGTQYTWSESCISEYKILNKLNIR